MQGPVKKYLSNCLNRSFTYCTRAVFNGLQTLLRISKLMSIQNEKIYVYE